MKKFKGMLLCGICACVLCVGIGCFAGLLKANKSHAEVVEVANFAELQTAVGGNKENIVICNDIDFSSTLEISRKVNLSANGDFCLRRASGFGGTMLSISSGANLSVTTAQGTSLSLDGQETAGDASAVVNKGTFVLGENAFIKNFTAAVNGVAVLNSGTFTLAGGEISNNVLAEGASDVYGIVRNERNAAFGIEQGKITQNTTATDGIIFMFDGSSIDMTGGEISSNEAVNGGAIFFKSAVAKLTGGIVSSNHASTSGGAFYLKDNADVTLDGVEIVLNTADSYGGASYLTNNAKCTLKSGLVKENSVKASGGAVFLTGLSSFVMDGGEVSSNTAANNGGAFCVKTNLLIGGGVIRGNGCSGGSSKGGAIYAYDGGNVDITSGTFAENTCYQGGAICANYGGYVKVAGGDFYANTASYRGNDVYGMGDTKQSPVFSTVELVGGSLEKVDFQYGVIKLGGSVKISGQITGFAGLKADYAYVEIVSDLENEVKIKPYKFTLETAATANCFLRNGINSPYSNIYKALSKVTYTDATKTQIYDGSKVLLVAKANVIDVVADEFAIEVNKTASDGEVVEFGVMKEWEILNLSIMDASGNAVAFTKSGDKYSFVMPTGSGVKIDYDAQKKNLALGVDAGVAEFVSVGTSFKFKDLVSLSLKEVEGKRLQSLYVSNGTYSQTLDLAKPEFLMFAGATIFGECKNLFDVSAQSSEHLDRVEFLTGTKVAEGDKVEFNVFQNKTGINATYSITSVYYEIGGVKTEIAKTNSGTYSFVMPSGDVEIKFVFESALADIPGNVIAVTNEAELLSALSIDEAVVTVLDDITISQTIRLAEGTHTLLSINGSSIVRGQNLKGDMISLGWKSVLNLGIEDVKNSLFLDGNNVDGVNGSVVFLEDGAVVNMFDGVVIRNNKVMTENVNYASFGKGSTQVGGAGVYNYNGIFNMFGGSISNNFTTQKGAGVCNFGRFNLFGGAIENNSTSGSGAGVYNYRVFNQDGGDVLNNVGQGASSYGAGVFVHNSYYAYYYLVSGKVSGNNSLATGAGVFCSDHGVVWIKGGEISSNVSAKNGGAISCKGMLFMLDGKIDGNTASSKGGALYTYEEARIFIKGGTISNNTASNGGAFCVNASAKVEITGGTFSNNSATSRGGAIYLYRDSDKETYPVGVVTLKSATISDNNAPNGSQVCVQYGVLEIGDGANIMGGIKTVANPTADYAYVRFVGVPEKIVIDPHKYANYENETFNVLRVAEGVDADAVASQIQIANVAYDVKTDGTNIYIFLV